MIGGDWKILFWNQGAEKITGYQGHEALGRCCRESILINCNEHDCIDYGTACALASPIHDGKICETQGFLRHKHGHRVPVHLRVAPIRDQQRQIIGAAASFNACRPRLPRCRHRGFDSCLHRLPPAGKSGFPRTAVKPRMRFFTSWVKP
jgi:PAS domain S-box-containing protein